MNILKWVRWYRQCRLEDAAQKRVWKNAMRQAADELLAAEIKSLSGEAMVRLLMSLIENNRSFGATSPNHQRLKERLCELLRVPSELKSTE